MASLIDISFDLSESLKKLRFEAPTTHVYDPLIYARQPHEAYLQKYGSAPKEAVFIGMNPGPYGMAQTGVPFGEIAAVRDWLAIEAPVEKPKNEHPKRPILGFACERSEVSGRRLWGWAKEVFQTPEAFFQRFFVVNYCPLVFMEESGRNRTPDKLPVHEREGLFRLCDAALRESITALSPQWVIGIGAFAEGRARAALSGLDLQIGRILHPSPASPAANRGWAEAASKELSNLGFQL